MIFFGSGKYINLKNLRMKAKNENYSKLNENSSKLNENYKLFINGVSSPSFILFLKYSFKCSILGFIFWTLFALSIDYYGLVNGTKSKLIQFGKPLHFDLIVIAGTSVKVDGTPTIAFEARYQHDQLIFNPKKD